MMITHSQMERPASSFIRKLGLSTHSHRSCPYCHSHGVYRESRKGFVWGLSALGLRPYRCLDCDRVHFGFCFRR
jgi:hypothetical protein